MLVRDFIADQFMIKKPYKNNIYNGVFAQKVRPGDPRFGP